MYRSIFLFFNNAIEFHKEIFRLDIGCARPPTPSNGVVRPNNKQQFSNFESVLCHCIRGYRQTGYFQVTCSNGSWSQQPVSNRQRLHAVNYGFRRIFIKVMLQVDAANFETQQLLYTESLPNTDSKFCFRRRKSVRILQRKMWFS